MDDERLARFMDSNYTEFIFLFAHALFIHHIKNVVNNF